jgi:hypothetical protein
VSAMRQQEGSLYWLEFGICGACLKIILCKHSALTICSDRKISLWESYAKVLLVMFLYSNNLFAFMKSKTLVEFGGLYYIYMYIMRCIIGTN